MGRTHARRIAVALTTLLACSSRPDEKPERQPPPKDELDAALEAATKVETEAQPKAIDPCSPSLLGLSAARPLKPWAAPTECTGRSGPAGLGTIASEAAFAKRFSCPRGVASGIDFGKLQLMVEDRTLSPAGAGTIIVDDGATVTFIERMRSPCPGDPQPMPIGYTLGFLLPAGADRKFATRNCTMPPQCGP
ncbi:MAG: hypothetical protein IPK74_06790 [Deltaproteobacteria bacterium]|nr:hypothetical protein [Deltaproteobacteria bacterium]